MFWLIEVLKSGNAKPTPEGMSPRRSSRRYSATSASSGSARTRSCSCVRFRCTSTVPLPRPSKPTAMEFGSFGSPTPGTRLPGTVSTSPRTPLKSEIASFA